MNVISIILAAGKGTRMKSSIPKPLQEIGGRSLIEWLLVSLNKIKIKEKVFVLGDQSNIINNYLGEINYVIQKPQLGTGHAVKKAQKKIKDFESIFLISYADTPFVKPETLEKLINNVNKETPIAILGFNAENPSGYGRIIKNRSNNVIKIVEERDANENILNLNLCNSGIMAVEGKILFEYLDKVQKSKNGEYYLTDIVKICSQNNKQIKLVLGSEDEFFGVNNKNELAKAEKIIQDKMRNYAMSIGVTLKDPETVFFNHDTELENDVTIEPNVVFGPKVTIKTNTIIKSFSYLEGCQIGENSIIGPFARIRPGSVLDQKTKIGNFVEIKNSKIKKSSKINHLSYIGDTEVGENSNIGAGSITCNYDGVNKHNTKIGNKVFIGSNTSLVAPLTIGDGAIIGAGSTITKNVKQKTLNVERSTQREFKIKK